MGFDLDAELIPADDVRDDVTEAVARRLHPGCSAPLRTISADQRVVLGELVQARRRDTDRPGCRRRARCTAARPAGTPSSASCPCRSVRGAPPPLRGCGRRPGGAPSGTARGPSALRCRSVSKNHLNVLSVNCSIATTASALARSPARWPPMPSATRNRWARSSPTCSFGSGRLVCQTRIALLSSAIRN